MPDLKDYEGKRVVVQINGDEGQVEEVEGKVEAASAIGLLLKPKGRNDLRLIEATDIVDVDSPAEPVRKLSCRWIKDVEPGGFRRHLVDRHGATLSYVNSLTEEKAEEVHASTDHTDLGHQHGEKPAKPEGSKSARDKAIEEAEAANVA